MIKRRAFLSAFPLLFAGACARAQASQQSPTKMADMTNSSGATLGELTGGVGKLVWLSLAGTVRLTLANANVRPVTLHRAIMLNADGNSARIFDVWQIGGTAAIAAQSPTLGTGRTDAGPNDLGINSVWLNRSFTYLALQAPIENSRLSRQNARVMVIDETQIWLVEGGVGPAPALTDTDLAAFEAWRAA